MEGIIWQAKRNVTTKDKSGYDVSCLLTSMEHDIRGTLFHNISLKERPAEHRSSIDLTPDINTLLKYMNQQRTCVVQKERSSLKCIDNWNDIPTDIGACEINDLGNTNIQKWLPAFFNNEKHAWPRAINLKTGGTVEDGEAKLEEEDIELPDLHAVLYR